MPDTTTPDQVTAGPYSIGSDIWPGLAKVAEECAEVIQVIGKIIAAGGADSHWDGSNLRARLENEIADARAALLFLQAANSLDAARIGARSDEKLDLFLRWHREHKDGSLNRDAS